MGWFVREFFAESPMLLFPVAALLLFIVVFTMIAVRTFRMKRDDAQALARLAIDSEERRHG